MGGRVMLVGKNLEANNISAYSLRQRGIVAMLADSPALASSLWASGKVDLVVIDVHVGGCDPIDLCRRLRNGGGNPIIILDARRDESHIISAYDAGVDEYIRKPISPALLLAKVEAWLRWARPNASINLQSVQVGPLQLDAKARKLIVGNGATNLTNLEVRLLQVLLHNPGQVMRHELLIDLIWGIDGGDAAMLKNLVYRLRRKLANVIRGLDECIVTVVGAGYLVELGRAPAIQSAGFGNARLPSTASNQSVHEDDARLASSPVSHELQSMSMVAAP